MKHIRTLIIIAVLLSVFLVITLATLHQSQDVRSRAQEETSITIVPTVPVSLQSPYIRLVSPAIVHPGTLIPVDLYLNTGGKSLTEAQIALVYDPSQVLLDQKDIRNNMIFPVLSVDSSSPGKVFFTLFLTEESGYRAVNNNREQKVATMFFRVGNTKGQSTIFLSQEGDDATKLFSERDLKTQKLIEIPFSVANTAINIP